MKFDLSPIDVVDDISKVDFEKNYLNPRKPLVIKNIAKKRSAYEKWSMNYMKYVVERK